jgi:hypothetical protein
MTRDYTTHNAPSAVTPSARSETKRNATTIQQYAPYNNPYAFCSGCQSPDLRHCDGPERRDTRFACWMAEQGESGYEQLIDLAS